MPKCGIKRFDELPSRVGLTNIDAIRADLVYSVKKLNKFVKKVNKLKQELESQRIKWEKNQKKKY